jgi:hypothetical protein
VTRQLIGQGHLSYQLLGTMLPAFHVMQEAAREKSSSTSSPSS